MGATLGATAYRSGTEQGLTHRLGRRALVTLQQVAVYVLGDGDAGMPEHLGDHVQRRPWAKTGSVAVVYRWK